MEVAEIVRWQDLFDDSDDQNGDLTEEEFCPCGPDQDRVEKGGYITCTGCGLSRESLGGGNVLNGTLSNISIVVSGNGAGRYGKLARKESTLNPEGARYESIKQKYLQRNYMNNGIIPALIIDEATGIYYRATRKNNVCRSSKAQMMMAAALYEACKIHHFYKFPAEIAEFMGQQRKGISPGLVNLRKRAAEDPSIGLSKSDDTLEDIASALFEALMIIDPQSVHIRAVLSITRDTLQRNIAPSFTNLSRILGVILFYNENIMRLQTEKGFPITEKYITDHTRTSSGTLRKVVTALGAYKRSLKINLKNANILRPL